MRLDCDGPHLVEPHLWSPLRENRKHRGITEKGISHNHVHCCSLVLQLVESGGLRWVDSRLSYVCVGICGAHMLEQVSLQGGDGWGFLVGVAQGIFFFP